MEERLLESIAWLGADVQRLLVAVALGACIGWEREWRRKPAGLRTHILVALGSAAFVLVSLRLDEQGEVAIDASRVVQGVVGGIGFLGAGTILQGRAGVEGLTTAATLWLTAAVGVAAAVGAHAIALCVTLLALAALLSIGFFTSRPSLGIEPEDPRPGERDRRRSAAHVDAGS